MILAPPGSTLFPVPTLFRSWTLTLAAAAAVAAIPGAAPAARRAYGFELRPHPGSPNEVLQIATANARVVAADRKSTRLNSSHANILYAVFCLKKKHTGKDDN